MMMSIKISLSELMSLAHSLASHTDNLSVPLDLFLTIPKDDYYFYGREPLDAEYLTIPISDLGRILSYPGIKENRILYDILNEVYQSGITTGQQSVFVYGRNKT